MVIASAAVGSLAANSTKRGAGGVGAGSGGPPPLTTTPLLSGGRVPRHIVPEDDRCVPLSVLEPVCEGQGPKGRVDHPSERQVARTRLIRANDDSPLVDPLREILTVATGPVVILAEELARIDGIESAFLYGSFAARMLGDAGPAPHDIDVMVLGEPDVDAVYEACARIEAAVHRPVNPTILTPEEFAAPSAFLDNVRSGPAVAVIGDLPWR
jgi:hypothetical protein